MTKSVLELILSYEYLYKVCFLLHHMGWGIVSCYETWKLGVPIGIDPAYQNFQAGVLAITLSILVPSVPNFQLSNIHNRRVSV